jgi:hypothetical protein
VVTSKKLTSEVVTALATDLTSGVTADVDGAIAAPPEWTPSAETVAQFDALKLTANAVGITSDSPGNGTVTYTVTDPTGKTTEWTTSLLYSGTRWQLTLTEEAR